MWHDINGVDTNTYTYQTLLTLKPFNTWGGSWYEETPDYRGMVIKGSAFPVLNVTGGPFNVTTGGGGANDYTNLGGSSEHQHSFEHDHGDGSINIIPSGAHPNHTVTWNGSGAYLEVAAVAAGTGQRVSIWGHEHNISIVGGDHTHQNVNFAGRVEQLAGNNALTALASSWVPYREAIICIKK
jgi:hypothetical protein